MKKTWKTSMVIPPRFAVEKKKKKMIMAIAKLFVLYSNAIHSKILILQSTRLDYCMRLVKTEICQVYVERY